jgi:lipopolysaccharide transport system ATP-binding protein
MSRRVIRRKFDEIVSFSEVGQFIDTPVKHYSSGMRMRLAFAVAAHLEPDVLVLDEVLAVGDAHFQRRCVGKMNEVAGQGRTVLLVSHQLDMISKLCGRAILLRSGRLAFDGQVKDALEIYTRCGQKDSNDERTSPREGTGEVRFGDVRASRDMYEPEEEKKFYFEVRPSTRSHDRYYISALVLNSRSETVFQIDSRVFGLWYDPRGTQRGTIVIRHPWMQPGDYTVDMYLCNTDRVVDKFDSAIAFSISPTLPYPCVTHPGATSHGPVLGDYSFSEVTGNLIGEGL